MSFGQAELHQFHLVAVLDNALAQPMQVLRRRRSPILGFAVADPAVGRGELARGLVAVEPLGRPTPHRGGRAIEKVPDAQLQRRREDGRLGTGAELRQPALDGRARARRQAGDLLAEVGEGLQRRLAVARRRHFARDVARLDPQRFRLLADDGADQAHQRAPALERFAVVVDRHRVGDVLRIERLAGARDDVAQQRRKGARCRVLEGIEFARHAAIRERSKHYDSFRRTGLPICHIGCYIRGVADSPRSRFPRGGAAR